MLIKIVQEFDSSWKDNDKTVAVKTTVYILGLAIYTRIKKPKNKS